MSAFALPEALMLLWQEYKQDHPDDGYLRIPGQAGHPFRTKPIIHSGPSRSLIPAQAGHRFRSKPITWHDLIFLL